MSFYFLYPLVLTFKVTRAPQGVVLLMRCYDNMVIEENINSTIRLSNDYLTAAILPWNAISYAIKAHESISLYFPRLRQEPVVFIESRQKFKVFDLQPVDRSFSSASLYPPVLLCEPG